MQATSGLRAAAPAMPWALRGPRPVLPRRQPLYLAAAACAGGNTPRPRPAAPPAAAVPRPGARGRGGAPGRGAPAPPAAQLRRSGSGTFDPFGDLQRELGMQSNRLDPDVREKVEAAIVGLGYRGTVGDVAARAGVKLSEADAALKALAFDAGGHLEVSREGEVIYKFEPNFKSTLRNKSWLQRVRPLFKKAQAVGAYLVRVAFGSALIVSVLLVWLAIVALTSSRDGDRRDRGGGYGGGYYHGGGLWLDPYDLFLWADPRYGRHSRERLDSGRRMNFVEGIFSVVFGDGDPNMSYEERRWRALGKHIQKLGGVVSAEEMAPFLDPPPLPDRLPSGPNKYEDEAFVLPALIRFGGEPFVDENGGLLYRFPALQVQAGSEMPKLQMAPQQTRVPLEREFEFSAASPGQQLGALALGVVNVVGVVVLSTMLADPVAKLALYRQGLGFVLGLLPALQAYAAAFFAIPLVRGIVDARRNVAIEDRNEARLQALEVLSTGGDRQLEAKLASARKLGGRKVIGRQDIVYTTEQGTDEQLNRSESEEFDRKLRARGGGGGGNGGNGRAALPPGAGNRIDDVFGRGGGARGREKEPEGSGGWDERPRTERRRRADDWDDLRRW